MWSSGTCRPTALGAVPGCKQALGLANATCCGLFQKLDADSNRKFNYLMRLIQVYEPFVFFKGRFDDKSLERLRLAIKDGNEAPNQMLGFDPKCIDWEDYMMNIHIPGLMRHNKVHACLAYPYADGLNLTFGVVGTTEICSAADEI
ncbi:hypothetical protein ACLOJK_020708 [Asimina triloba]